MNEKISTIITELSNELDSYNESSKKITGNLGGNYKFNIKFDNERSIAYFVSNKLETLFRKHIDGNAFFLNECALTTSKGFNTEEMKDIGKDIESINESIESEMRLKKEKRKFIPDLLISTDFVNGFIEYKCEIKYQYIKLANDYLKYKLYTKDSTKDSFFVYIIFRKKDGIILDCSYEEKYKKLDETLQKSDLNEDISIYIHYKDHNNEIKDMTETIYNERIEVLNRTENKVKELLELGDFERFNNVIDYSNCYFHQQLNKIGKNVISANIISNNIELIQELFVIFLEKANKSELKGVKGNVLLKLIKETGYSYNSNIALDEELQKITQKYNEDIKKVHGEAKSTMSKDNFSVSYKRSNWIIILILMCCKINDVVPTIHEKKFNDLMTHFDDNINKFEHIYQADHSLSSYLAFGLLYYIVNYYTLIYTLVDNEKVEFNEDYKFYKYKKEIITEINKKFKKDSSTKHLVCEITDTIEQIGEKVVKLVTV